MKVRSTLLTICAVALVIVCQAQTDRENTGMDTVKQMNLLDEQTKMFNQIFTIAGASDTENPTGGADNYLDMINSMEASEELKQQIREIYDLYDTSLDPTRKEELKIKVDKMLNEAMDKGLLEN